ncbi:unnamed protein product, partial [marine sediment metagenome]
MCQQCNKKPLTLNAIAKGDPTRTLTIRKAFANDGVQRV